MKHNGNISRHVDDLDPLIYILPSSTLLLQNSNLIAIFWQKLNPKFLNSEFQQNLKFWN